MKVIAMALHGDAYAIEVEDDQVRIYQPRQRRLLPAQPAGEVLSRPNWQQFVGDPEWILERVREAMDG